jgi:hypothetical protein
MVRCLGGTVALVLVRVLVVVCVWGHKKGVLRVAAGIPTQSHPATSRMDAPLAPPGK